jgi:UDPglucose--hexose-1-phosphate uridylyltransferase
MEQAARYFDSTGRCVFCHMMEREAKEKERIVLETEKFVSFVPYASFAPFTTWIVPRRHMTSFDEIDAEETRDLVRSLKTILGKLYRGLENPDFNYTIRSVPVKEKGVEYFHWYVTVIPRLSQPAGFEIGSGIFINVSIPEDNAKFLRGVK